MTSLPKPVNGATLTPIAEGKHMNIEFIRGATLHVEEPRPVDLAEQVQAAREFVKRHPALTPIDLDEFDTFMRFPKAFNKLVSAEDAR